MQPRLSNVKKITSATLEQQNPYSLNAHRQKTAEVIFLSITKLLQKSGIRKNEVIELIYRGFI